MIAAFWLVGCGGGESTWMFHGATSLMVELGNGDVEVTTSFDDTTVVNYDGGGIGRAAFPDVYQERDGGVVIDAGGALGGGDVNAEVPPGLPLAVFVDRGDISIELEAPADIEACVGAGSVSIGVPAGAYAVDLGTGAGHAGSEIVDDPSAPFSIRACAGAGDVEVHPYDPSRIDRDDDDHDHRGP